MRRTSIPVTVRGPSTIRMVAVAKMFMIQPMKPATQSRTIAREKTGMIKTPVVKKITSCYSNASPSGRGSPVHAWQRCRYSPCEQGQAGEPDRVIRGTHWFAWDSFSFLQRLTSRVWDLPTGFRYPKGNKGNNVNAPALTVWAIVYPYPYRARLPENADFHVSQQQRKHQNAGHAAWC